MARTPRADTRTPEQKLDDAFTQALNARFTVFQSGITSILSAHNATAYDAATAIIERYARNTKFDYIEKAAVNPLEATIRRATSTWNR